MMARNDTRDTYRSGGVPTDAVRTDAGVRRPVANALTVVGTLLIVIGGWSILRAIGLVPDGLAQVVGDWWALALVVGGGWLFWQGRRAIGAVLALLGAVNLTFSLVPSPLIGPVLLIGAGIVLVVGAMGGWRRFTERPGEALLDELRGSRSHDLPTRSVVALFDDAEGTIEVGVDAPGVVECLAVFGDVKVTVPRDVALELRQTAVFGDVRAPEPPTGSTVATVQVRATSVFGDVRITRL
jgi:hypothetical protein